MYASKQRSKQANVGTYFTEQWMAAIGLLQSSADGVPLRSKWARPSWLDWAGLGWARLGWAWGALCICGAPGRNPS